MLAPARAQITQGWSTRLPLRIESEFDVQGYAVRVVLEPPAFDAAQARPDLADLRFTRADGVTYLPHWLESFDGRKAVVWVRTDLSMAEETLVYAYYGNHRAASLSSGYRTFDFFDDFDRAGPGYFPLGEPRTISVRDQPWETQAPHTLSVVELNRGGYRYWGYYGLADCGGIGILRSNDLSNWEKVPGALLSGDGERWPSAHVVNGRVALVYDRDHCQTSHVVMRMGDGEHFEPTHRVLVAQEAGVRNQNPHLYYDPPTRRFYLYWFRGGQEAGFWQIKVRVSATLEGLADASSERVLLEEPYTLAAPNMMFQDGVYYLSTEVNENAWKTKIYAGASPLGPFEPIPGAMVLTNNEACWFQHQFGGRLHGYFCKDTRGDGQGWVLQHRVGDLSARMRERALDGTFWAVERGNWRIVYDSQGNGALVGDAGARARSHIPAGAGKIVESRIGPVAVEGERLTLIGDGQQRFDDVRIRKVSNPEPLVRPGQPAARLSPGQRWYSVGLGVTEPTTPAETLGAGACIAGALALLAGAAAVLRLTLYAPGQRIEETQ